MANFKISNVKIAGICCSIPKAKKDFCSDEYKFNKKLQEIKKHTGVNEIRISDNNTTTSDLCCKAAIKLLEELDWKSDSIDILIFVSQTNDYKLPATSCILQNKLNLSKNCMAFDINLGCSGYIYGLQVVSSILSSGFTKRALLLVGDTSTKTISKDDNTVCYLFGDAGTVTALEFSPNAEPMNFILRTDGKGYDSLIIPAGGFRNQSSHKTLEPKIFHDGNVRCDENLLMNGPNILTFALNEIPALYFNLLKISGHNINKIDAIIMHQANLFILNYLAKKMGIDTKKMPISLDKFGNTSSGSIPLTMAYALRDRLRSEKMELVLIGFGVGYSWGACTVQTNSICIPSLIEI